MRVQVLRKQLEDRITEGVSQSFIRNLAAETHGYSADDLKRIVDSAAYQVVESSGPDAITEKSPRQGLAETSRSVDLERWRKY